jgi:MEMO1 family protein
MTAPSFKGVRSPAVAGLFYPESPDACRKLAQQLLCDAPRHPAESSGGLGGLVPHAGWICSGEVAAETLVQLATGQTPDLVVVFGAAHTMASTQGAALDSHAAWALPTGQIQLPQAIETQLAQGGHGFVIDSRMHEREHAVEVQMPFLQLLWPDAAILPVTV